MLEFKEVMWAVFDERKEMFTSFCLATQEHECGTVQITVPHGSCSLSLTSLVILSLICQFHWWHCGVILDTSVLF